MPYITYRRHRFKPKAVQMIRRSREILEEYAAKGYILSVRQVYYLHVARGWLENNERNYQLLIKVLGNARLAGSIDWSHIEDRTRNLRGLQHFAGPQDALDKLKRWYHVDMWAAQKFRPEVFVEKDALVGVIQRVCDEHDIPYFSCRGYTSLSEMWAASMRLRAHMTAGQTPYIIHFGDHDPSGVDMSRDICDRLRKTFLSDCVFKRVALNMDQIEEFKPPPNPAKLADSRCKAYIKRFGHESWELDALDPDMFRTLIEGQLDGIRDDKQWKKDEADKAAVTAQLDEIGREWTQIAERKKEVKTLRKELDERLAEITKARTEIEKLKKRKKK